MKRFIIVLIAMLVVSTAYADYYSYDQERKKEFSEADVIRLVKKELLKAKQLQLELLKAEIERMEREMNRGY